MSSFDNSDARQRVVFVFLAAILAFSLTMPAVAVPGPVPPGGLECRSGVGAVGLSWNGSPFVAYRIERGDDEPSAVQIAVTGATSFVDETTPVGQTQTWLVRTLYADGTTSAAVSCQGAAIAPGAKPFLGPPVLQYDDRTVLTFGLPTAARTTYGLTAELRRVPSPGWEARLFVGLFDVGGALAAELATAPATLAPGDGTFTDSVEIDALVLDLPVGSYAVRGTLVATPPGELPSDLGEVVEAISSSFEPALAFISGPDDALQVLDRGDDDVAAYWTAIGSGNADTAYKAVSALMSHYRARGLFSDSEQGILTAADVDVLKPYSHILRYWTVDDRLLAGDHDGAVGILTGLIDEASPDTGFLGEPYRARGLFDLAGLHLRVGDHEAAYATLSQLVAEAPMFHRPTVRSLLGEQLLELGEATQARAVFQDVVESAERCTSNEREPCPTVSQVETAGEWIDLIESPREWFREQPEELIEILETVVAERDVELLQSIVPARGLGFVISAGEHSRARWTTLQRFFSDALELSPDLRLEVRPAYGPRQSVVLAGLAPEAGAGHSRSVVLTLERLPFGWQWDSVAGIQAMSYMDDDDDGGGWDPCSIDPDTGLPTCTQPPPPPTPPTGGTPARLQVQAPWAPGAHMRAGGLSADLSAFENGEMALDLVVDLLSPLNDRCGNSLPGYLYGLGTHTNEDHYAIDFTQGYTLFCVWGVCVTPPGVMLAELLEALGDSLLGSPTMTPAYNDPVHAARAGLVIDSNCTFNDGDTDSSHANKVEVAVWEYNDPVSIARLLETVPNGSATKGQLLNQTQADYWLRYLHLRKGFDCPSRGSWVEQGQVIGRIDDSGNSFTSHLHFVVRHRPDTGAGSTSNWASAVQVIEGNRIGHEDNGACIKSHNELVRIDTDGDGILDPFDNCTTEPNPDQLDVDFDMIGEACDDNTCPWDAVEDWDDDGQPDACDPDVDGDGVANDLDACPYYDDAVDMDGDGEPDGCDRDVDGDGFSESCEADFVLACGCLVDLEPMNPAGAGDHDGDNVDSLNDPCPCSDVNPTCNDMIDLPPPGLGGAAAAEWGEPHGPGSPYDPYGPGGSPYGPGGQFP